MAERTALLLDLKVNRLLPSPANASVGIGHFRVPCLQEQGDPVVDRSVSLPYGDTLQVGACSTLVIRTTKPLTVTLTIGGSPLELKVNSLLVLTTPVEQAVLAFNAVGGSGVAVVSVIQA